MIDISKLSLSAPGNVGDPDKFIVSIDGVLAVPDVATKKTYEELLVGSSNGRNGGLHAMVLPAGSAFASIVRGKPINTIYSFDISKKDEDPRQTVTA